ncbi:MAG: hypothetical protein Q4G61_11415 [Tissierellia bacterium]|nr:hypothetical protein [Tissierellia bacterium]
MKKGIKRMALGLALVMILGTTAFASEDLGALLREELSEEMKAKAMYEELSAQHPEIRSYQRLIRAEENHVNAVKQVLDSKGISYDDVVAGEYELPEDKLEQAQYAKEFEIDDVAELTERRDNTEDEQTKELLERLRRGSENHVKAMTRLEENLIAGKDPQQGGGQVGGRMNNQNSDMGGRMNGNGNGLRDGRGMGQGNMENGLRDPSRNDCPNLGAGGFQGFRK